MVFLIYLRDDIHCNCQLQSLHNSLKEKQKITELTSYSLVWQFNFTMANFNASTTFVQHKLHKQT
jgi:hypothetical protein